MRARALPAAPPATQARAAGESRARCQDHSRHRALMPQNRLHAAHSARQTSQLAPPAFVCRPSPKCPVPAPAPNRPAQISAMVSGVRVPWAGARGRGRLLRGLCLGEPYRGPLNHQGANAPGRQGSTQHTLRSTRYALRPLRPPVCIRRPSPSPFNWQVLTILFFYKTKPNCNLPPLLLVTRHSLLPRQPLLADHPHDAAQDLV